MTWSHVYLHFFSSPAPFSDLKFPRAFTAWFNAIYRFSFTILSVDLSIYVWIRIQVTSIIDFCLTYCRLVILQFLTGSFLPDTVSPSPTLFFPTSSQFPHLLRSFSTPRTHVLPRVFPSSFKIFLLLISRLDSNRSTCINLCIVGTSESACSVPNCTIIQSEVHSSKQFAVSLSTHVSWGLRSDCFDHNSRTKIINSRGELLHSVCPQKFIYNGQNYLFTGDIEMPSK